MNKEEFLNNKTSYGLMGLDLSLKNYLNFSGGFFIEAGANDGISQNNTKIFEDLFGWTGLLIEPSPSAFQKCVTNRPNCIKVNCALTNNDFIKTVKGDFDGHMMSSIDGKKRNNNNLVEVNSRTLKSILNQYNIDKVDFISLDVEGYELLALEGMDFNKWKPKYILIEVNGNDLEPIENYLSTFGYMNIANLSNFGPHNNPLWSGTHNDFLFELKNNN